MGNLLAKAFKYFKNLAALKKSDVYLVSFPKSGNTWVRFYICNLINQMPKYHFTDEAIDFKILDEVMPELGKNDLSEEWQFQGFPRIIKTHLAYNALLGDRRTILVMRDPRDVIVSFYKFEVNKSNPRFKGDIKDFIRHPKYGVDGWCKHYLSWSKHSNLIIRYEDLKANDGAIFQKMNSFLHVTVAPEIFSKALELARFENIKKVEDTKGLADPTKVTGNFKFARSGKTGQWKESFSESDLEYVKNSLKNHNINLYDDLL